ncbi:AMP-binding protein [Polyangium aurulentum]|uniref:AMP-binding protein n=1 Tax=Polyangium aurulentum TaxID=2567896 RepID=UPI0010AE2C6B|nr:AMP-binding protein [Polyangium aurulentum]UQA62186.1 AMP-binding protein [Polyangium aurulentum]
MSGTGASFRLSSALFEARGDRPALIGQGATTSYLELGRSAQAVADKLAALGVGPGDSVALVSVGRAHDEAVGLCGILFRGAVVVPLDATAPPARLASIASARGVRALVVDEAAVALADAMDGAGEPFSRVVLDGDGQIASAVGAPASVRYVPRDPLVACILHTSGSTGTPKPVPITWAGLDAFTSWAVALVQLSPQDRVLRVAELVFDLAWFDHIGCFRTGATLCTMGRRDLASGRALRDAMANLAPTVVYGVPSMFMKLASALPEGGQMTPAPRVVFFAGEVFPPRELKAFAEHLPPETRLFNLYGPTETNVCTYHEVQRTALDGERETPIGRPCPYALCKLVAEDGSLIRGPGVGELVVEGETTLEGGPYATRDRVERRADGLFYFRGRIDRMVKIRGYRVEPGEVEAALCTHPAVQQAAVIAHEDARLGKMLRGFVAAREGTDGATERDLRMYLAERLPPYMVPERITLLGDLPRTTTGKIDYAALG